MKIKWSRLFGVLVVLAISATSVPPAFAAPSANPTTLMPPYDDASSFTPCDLGSGTWQILNLEASADTTGGTSATSNIKTGDGVLANGSKNCAAFALVTGSFRVRKGASPTMATFNIHVNAASAFKTLIAEGFSKVALIGFIEDSRTSPPTHDSITRVLVDSSPETTTPDSLTNTNLTLEVPIEPSDRQGFLHATLQVVAISQLGFPPSETMGEADASVDAILTSISIDY